MFPKSRLAENRILNDDFPEYSYDEKTGNFFKNGSLLFLYTDKAGYKSIRIHGTKILCHRFAWRLFYGTWPNKNIDHINGTRSDNRIVNLRDATDQENASNCSRHRSGKLAGVSWYKSKNKWFSSVSIHYKLIKIGYFDTQIEAHEAYVKYCKSHGLMS